MSKKYILLEAAITAMTADNLLEHFDSVEDVIENRFHRAAERILASIPPADVVEVRYCSFALEGARRRESVYKCSACGNYLTVRADTLNGGRGDMNYCPFCGRKILHKGQDGGQNE